MNIHNEFNSITSMLLSNGYPLHSIKGQVRMFMNKKHANKSADNNASSTPNLPRVVFKLPHIGNPLLHAEKELKLFFKKKPQMKVRFTMVHISNLTRKFFQIRRQTTTLDA